MWNFSDLRAYLLPLAEKVLGDVDKIVFAREFDIKDWLAPAHVNLCQRSESLTTEEATKLGIHSLLMISRMRERPRPPASGQRQYYCSNCVGVAYYNTSSNCTRCGTYSSPCYYPNPNQSPSNTNNTLETQVKKWVEDGCVLKG